MANENGTKRGAVQGLQDLDAQVDPKGGKAGGDTEPKYMVITLKEVFIPAVTTSPTQPN